MQHVRFPGAPGTSTILLFLTGLVLAVDPAIWLVKSWLDPAYDSSGYLVFAISLGLFVWSASSPLKVQAENRHKQTAIALLILSGLVRLASQILAINTIGALCLVVDVFALAVLLRLPQRARPLSAFWLAGTFVFSLPLERILQRTIGYGLQHVSADGACAVLSGFYSSLVCEGTRIIVNGVDVLVDLPCSGAQTLLLGLLGFCIAAAICRAGPAAVAAGFVVTLASACVANSLRIAVLAVDIAEPQKFGAINVMAQPWHDLIGLASLVLVCAVMVIWVRLAWRPARAISAIRFALPAVRVPSPRLAAVGPPVRLSPRCSSQACHARPSTFRRRRAPRRFRWHFPDTSNAASGSRPGSASSSICLAAGRPRLSMGRTGLCW